MHAYILGIIVLIGGLCFVWYNAINGETVVIVPRDVAHKPRISQETFVLNQSDFNFPRQFRVTNPRLSNADLETIARNMVGRDTKIVFASN